MLILSENHTIVQDRDLGRLIGWAEIGESLGVDGVMLSEHITLGPSANERGAMPNPRAYAMPGNQDPTTPWPDSLLLLSAVAARTERLRLFAGAIIAPLRHPVLLAHQLATLDLLAEGRLIVQPTVSWHRDEYRHLDVPFDRRGQLLDEHLEIWRLLWRETPASYHGEHYGFDDVYLVPKPSRPEGPTLWFGGQRLNEPILRRLVAYGEGFHPLGQPTSNEMERLRARMRSAGRDPDRMEMVGGIRARFPDDRSPASLRDALASIPPQIAEGYTTFAVKPNQFIDDARDFEPFVRDLVAGFADLSA